MESVLIGATGCSGGGRAILVRAAPRCLEDGASTEQVVLAIETSRKNFFDPVSYCASCGKYVTKNGMESDIKKVALEFLDSSYRLSDIVKVTRTS